MRALFLFAAFMFFTGAWAQGGGAYVVRDMRVEGLQRISEGTVFNYLPVNIGDRLDSQRVAEALRAVYDTGFFNDVEFRWDDGTLVIAVRERPSIESFTISGNKDIKTEDLESSLRSVGLAAGKTFDRSVLDNVTQFLTDQYFSRGKYGVKVDASVEELPDNRVRIAIDVHEGSRAQILQINIVGNESFSDEKLLDEFELKTPHFMSRFKKDDRYSREALAGDLETLRSFYMDRGFANYQEESAQVAISPDKRDIFITINIKEGDQYTISDVKVSGKEVVPRESLEALIQLQPGDIFSRRRITQSTELMSFRLGQEGYAFADIQPIPEINEETKEVSINFVVEPNNRVYVRRINFLGANNVNDDVFRRELRQAEGGWLSNTAVDRSKVRIQRLPFVEEVEVQTNPVPGSPDLVDVDFSIKEGLPGQFGGGLGFSDSQKLILNGNFVHSNFMGTGNRVALELNSSRFRKIYSFSHTDPYRTIDGISRTLSLTYRDFVQFTSGSSDFSTETLTAAVQYGYPITEFQRLSFGADWQDATLLSNEFNTRQSQEWVRNNGNVTESMLPNGTQIFETEFQTVEILAGWTYDSRNRALFANRGSRHRLNFRATIPGSEVEYYIVNYDFVKYWPLFGQWTLRFNTDLGYAQDFGETTAPPPFLNFFAGGPDTVRGFRENRLGPRDSFGNPYGGNLKTAAQIELLVPTPEKWRNSTRISLFFDTGNVFSTGHTAFFDKLGDPIEYEFDVDQLKQSVGVAVQWLAPLGVFRFSYAFPFNEQPDTSRIFGDETEAFQFSVGSAF